MKPDEERCTTERGRELVTFDPDLSPIPRHDMNLIFTGLCAECGAVDEDRLKEVLGDA